LSRLVSFGCSFTYGYALSDAYDFDSGPSVFAWPNIAAKQLNLKCINNGIPGASNKEILHTIQNFEFKSSDIVCILWTYSNRWCIIKENSIENFVHHSKDKFTQFYFQIIYNEHDLHLDTFTRVNFAKMYLDSKGIKNLHFVVNSNMLKNVPKWSITKFEDLYSDDYRFRYPLGLDDKHPGDEAHKNFGLDVSKIINSFISC
jgi:hypothetical protein